MEEASKARRRDGNVTKNITGGHKGKRPLGKPKCKCEYNVKRRGVGQETIAWIGYLGIVIGSVIV